MPTYCIAYHFYKGIPFRGKIAVYPRSGITIQTEGQLIKSIKHTLQTDVLLSNDEARRRSLIGPGIMSLLWKILEFDYGLPLKASRISTKAIHASGPAESQVGADLDAAVCKPVILPDENVLTSAPPRLHAWLEFVNEARNTRSDAEAVRLYYNVLEDMCGRPTISGDSAALRIRYTRHFVSHGEVLHKDRKLLRFLQIEIGPGTNQYDPNNSVHRDFVRVERQKAREYLETKLELRRL